ncbi:hypothetical protein L6164_026869 [Bauhinia variegata]|uniref:Uncharacterized protein n=1 Tax=Bauhinia variegata TaxID=167791 RepID=A0ACB9LS32_BAUVA|nr:hypothetical protein L6164_026869 [Bauhinia variegata]
MLDEDEGKKVKGNMEIMQEKRGQTWHEGFREEKEREKGKKVVVDIDDIREPVSGSLLYGNNINFGVIIPTSAAIG